MANRSFIRILRGYDTENISNHPKTFALAITMALDACRKWNKTAFIYSKDRALAEQAVELDYFEIKENKTGRIIADFSNSKIFGFSDGSRGGTVGKGFVKMFDGPDSPIHNLVNKPKPLALAFVIALNATYNSQTRTNGIILYAGEIDLTDLRLRFGWPRRSFQHAVKTLKDLGVITTRHQGKRLIACLRSSNMFNLNLPRLTDEQTKQPEVKIDVLQEIKNEIDGQAVDLNKAKYEKLRSKDKDRIKELEKQIKELEKQIEDLKKIISGKTETAQEAQAQEQPDQEPQADYGPDFDSDQRGGVIQKQLVPESRKRGPSPGPSTVIDRYLKKVIVDENFLKETKWFDYRLITPDEATHRFILAYADQWEYAKKDLVIGHFDKCNSDESGREEWIPAGPGFRGGKDLKFEKLKARKKYWADMEKMRRWCDLHGIKYYKFWAYSWQRFIKLNFEKRFLNIFYSNENLQYVLDEFYSDYETRGFPVSVDPIFRKAERYIGLPEQDAYYEYLFGNFKLRYGRYGYEKAKDRMRIMVEKGKVAKIWFDIKFKNGVLESDVQEILEACA